MPGMPNVGLALADHAENGQIRGEPSGFGMGYEGLMHDELTLEAAARKMREAVKDNSYRGTPIGHEVARFLRWMRANEMAVRSTYEYESVLYRFALHFADLELTDFEPPAGTEKIEEYIDDGWGHTAPGTRAKLISILATFFRWHHERGRLTGNPMALIKRPKKRDSDRQAHSPHKVLDIVRAQPLARDRCALLLLGKMGLRKNELRLVQIKHFDFDQGLIRLLQKGGDVVYHPIVFPDVLAAVAEHVTLDGRDLEEYLIYPRWERTLKDGTVKVLKEVKTRAMSTRGVHEWWVRCLERAEVPHFPMHELRHTAGTEFHRAVHDLELTRRFMRHRSIQTTSSVYMHLDHEDLSNAMLKASVRWDSQDSGKEANQR